MLNLKEKLIDVLVKPKSTLQQKLDRIVHFHKKKNLPFLRLTKYKFDREIITLISEQICRRYGVIPLSLTGNTLTIAMSDPFNIFALDELETLTGYEINRALSFQEEINEAIDNHYSQSKAALILDYSWG